MREASLFASHLRAELGARSRRYGREGAHVESYGDPPVMVYAPDGLKHGNFFDPSYEAIACRPEWLRRFDKIHAQGRSLPKAERKWRELDSSMSSDALLMNVFCAPGVAQSSAVRRLLGVDDEEVPVFGWKARVPLANGHFDRTEVDMRWGSLLVEAKLTESDFQTCRPALVEGYRDLDAVFDRESLPRVQIAIGRRKASVELPEEYSQEEIVVPAEEWEPHVWSVLPESISGYQSYQLIRSVLAAHAHSASFCVMYDARRPDLREAWFEVMAAVKSADLRVRLQAITWQELAAVLPHGLQDFLDRKYGIVSPGAETVWPIDEPA